MLENMLEKMKASRAITRDYFDALLLEQRLMGSTEPNTSVTIFGETFSTPIMTAALSHLKPRKSGGETPMAAYARGAALANTVHWAGMTDTVEFTAVMNCGARTIRIIKPFADREKILAQIREAEERGALAVGMDIDHMFTPEGNHGICEGEALAVYGTQELKEILSATKLPFIVKGILSLADARQCMDLGAAGIVVSHHGGHMLSAVPPLMLLPDIRQAAGGAYPIFVDCGIASGLDAYKAMTLGATAVSVGTHLISYTMWGGAAVADQIR